MEVVEQRKLTAPKLRFREFEDGWKKEPIGNYINLFSGVALKGEEISEEQGGIPILRGINITEGFIRHNEKIDRFYHGEISGLENLLIQEGDLVLGMDGSKVGKNSAIVSAIDVGAILIQRVACLRPKKNGSIEFVFHHIHSSRFHQYVDVVNTSSGIPHISSKQIKDFRIWFPTLPEQQKIAGFLSAVDEKLQHLNRKKELLQQYKKGVMQKLFSQELRFKREDGSEYEDWEEKKLGDIAKFFKGKGLSKSEVSESGATSCVRYGELYTHYQETIDSTVSFTDVPTSQLVLSKANDVLIPASGETQLDIAKASCVIRDGVALGGDLNIIRTEQNGVFLAYYINSVKKFEIAQMAQGNSVVHLYSKQLQTVSLNLPCKKEQQKIADFLSSWDEKIEAVSAQIELTQQFKKGLLQEMFV